MSTKRVHAAVSRAPVDASADSHCCTGVRCLHALPCSNPRGSLGQSPMCPFSALSLRHVADGRPRVVQAVRGALERVRPGAAAHGYRGVHALPWALLSILLTPWQQQAVASRGRFLCEWLLAHVECLPRLLHRCLTSVAGEVLLRQPGSLHGLQRRRAVSHRVAQPSPPTRTHARWPGLAWPGLAKSRRVACFALLRGARR